MEQLKEWISLSSTSDDLAGLHQMLEALRSAFAPLEATEEILPLPSKKIWTLKGEKKVSFGKVLHLKKWPNAPIQIYLGGHYDTVHPTQHGAVKKQGDKLFGPGTADMKGGLFVLLEALKKLERQGGEKVGWEVLLNPDEELGSIASYPLIEEAAKRCDLALLFEPTLPDGSLVAERKGSFNGVLSVQGKASHVGRAFEQGKSAIYALAEWISTCPTLDGAQLNIGQITGGCAPNVVAENALASINIRYEKPFQKALKNHIEAIEKKHSVKITLYPLSERPPKPLTAATKKLIQALESVAPSINWQKTGGVCDGNLIAAKGVACLDTLGVIGDGLHTTDEYCLISSVEEKIENASLLLCGLNSGAITWENS